MRPPIFGTASAVAAILTTTLSGSPQNTPIDDLKERARAQGGRISSTLDSCGPLGPLPVLAAQADVIVQGRISHAVARLHENEHSAWVATDFTVAPTRIFKNAVALGTAKTPGPTPPIVFVQFGGTVRVDDVEITDTSNMSPVPALEVGEEVIVFLARKPGTNVFYVHYGAYGLLRVRGGTVVNANKEVAALRPLEDDRLSEVQRRIEDLVVARGQERSRPRLGGAAASSACKDGVSGSLSASRISVLGPHG